MPVCVRQRWLIWSRSRAPPDGGTRTPTPFLFHLNHPRRARYAGPSYQSSRALGLSWGLLLTRLGFSTPASRIWFTFSWMSSDISINRGSTLNSKSETSNTIRLEGGKTRKLPVRQGVGLFVLVARDPHQVEVEVHGLQLGGQLGEDDKQRESGVMSLEAQKVFRK